ncbi:hypothetical protein [Endozoicomonas sp. 8E]|uniref:hypothetical protein n=1 Tax=Endozoicomonas sp. 8E TaxID=3035692 RepID=UPI002939241A|nr:hypothetical protein [Endozoicomonas sp. 8E]WOG29864.1 hypothetical protein P6910_09475 [Endozoicomonas sp. 8E]
MNTSLQNLLGMPLLELASKSSTELLQLAEAARLELEQIKSLKDFIDGAIGHKYVSQVTRMRTEQGKECGVVHLLDEGIKVSADLPKRVTWDQKQLKTIADKIAAQGEDPAEYLEVSYKVAERKYSAWPDTIRKAFESARTLKTGKPVYKLSSVEEDAS